MTQKEINLLNAIMERVSNFDDALRITNKSFTEYEGEESDDTARRKAKIITEALNTNEEGKKWEADFSNHSQWKYFVYGYGYKPGVGFSGFGYGHGHDYSLVGSRLCFASSELALYAAKTFPEIYTDLLK